MLGQKKRTILIHIACFWIHDHCVEKSNVVIKSLIETERKNVFPLQFSALSLIWILEF